MPYLLDTNAWITFFRKPSSTVGLRLAALQPSEVFLCSIVKAELYFGAQLSGRQAENSAALERYLAPYPSLPFDDQAARIYGRIRREVEQIGLKVGGNDVMIAAIALAHSLTIVTHNTSEFARFSGLQIEDWQVTRLP